MSSIAGLLRKLWPPLKEATPALGTAIATGVLGVDPQVACLAVASAAMVGVDFLMDREAGRDIEEIRLSLRSHTQQKEKLARQILWEQPQLAGDFAASDPIHFERVLFRWLQGEFREARDLQRAIHDQLESATRFFDEHSPASAQLVDVLSRIDKLDADLQQLVRDSSDHLANQIQLVGETSNEILEQVRQLAKGVSLAPAGLAILPARPPVVVGRDPQIAQFVAAVTADSPPPVAILGHPGIGKSTVSLAGAHEESVRQRFKDRRIFVRCDGAESVESLTKQIAIALGCAESNEPLRQVLFALAGAPTLLILDNFETPWTADRERVEELLRQLIGAGPTALVVSVRGPQVPLTEMIRIEPQPLTLVDSRDAFCRHADGFHKDPDLERLVDPLDGVPLAIYLLARSARGRSSLADLVVERDELRTRAFSTGTLSDDPARRRLQDLQFSFELSLRLGKIDTHPAARALLAALSLLPDGATPDHLRTVFPGAEHTRAQKHLIDLGLIYTGAKGRVRMLAPLREYLRSRLKTETKARSRIAEFYLALAEEYGEKPGHPGGAKAVAVLTPEAGNTESLLEHLLSGNSGNLPTLKRVLLAIYQLAEYQRHTGWGTTRLMVLASQAALKTGDVSLSAKIIERLGDIALARSDHEGARLQYEAALPLYQQVGDVLGEANCIDSLGEIALSQSDLKDAEEQYEKALSLYQQIGSVLGAANCIKGLGDIALASSNHVEAGKWYNAGLVLYQQIGGVLGEANCIMGLAEISLRRIEHEESSRMLELALQLFLQVGSVLGEAGCTLKLGDIALARLNLDFAEECYEKSLPLYRQLGFVRGEAACIRSLGSIALERSNLDAARNHFELAKRLCQQAGDSMGQANCIQGLGSIAAEHFDFEEARAQYKSALDLYESIPEGYSVGVTLLYLSDIAATPEDRTRHREAARAAWLSIGRGDLVEQYLAGD
jgi:tetratricopeptide (TPR) repeat protein